MIEKRFLLQKGGLLWAASLFDRRTWPLTDMKFIAEDVQSKLQCLADNFPACNELCLLSSNFIPLAQKLTQDVPPVRSPSGRIRAIDSVEAWTFAINRLQTKEWNSTTASLPKFHPHKDAVCRCWIVPHVYAQDVLYLTLCLSIRTDESVCCPIENILPMHSSAQPNTL